MKNLLMLELYRIKHSKKFLILLIVFSIIWNNIFAVYQYGENMFQMDGLKYWNTFSDLNLFLPFCLIIIIGFYLDACFKAHINELEKIAGFTENTIIFSKIIVLSMTVIIILNGIFIAELLFFSFMNGSIGNVLEFVIRNFAYCIGIITIITITVMIIFIVEQVYKGAFLAFFTYIILGIAIGCVITVVEAVANVSLRILREMLLFYQFGIYINSGETGETTLQVFGFTVISYILHLSLFYLMLRLSKVKKLSDKIIH